MAANHDSTPSGPATPTTDPGTRSDAVAAEEKIAGGVLAHVSSRDGEDEEPGAGSGRDPEGLSRVSSGPAYTTFSRGTRRWIITMVTFSSFVSPMTANIYFPALPSIAADLGVSIDLVNLTLTTYMIFQGIGPTLFGDFGDMAGRRPAFIVAFTIYIFANIGLALQDNYAALLILRMMQSGGSAGTLALGYAVVADVAASGERGKYMGYIGAGINIGPAISPVLAGILSEYLGWRAIFWFCAIFVGVWLVPYILFVPETCRNVVGNGSIPPQGWNRTLVDYIRIRRGRVAEQKSIKRKIRFPNPFNALAIVFEKDLGILLWFNTILYLAFMMIIATLSTLFKDIYKLNDLQVGLCYLPYGVGCCVSTIAQGYVLDWNYRRIAKKIGFTINLRKGDDLSKYPIEKARMQPLIPILAVGLVAVICYGWVLQIEAPLAAPLVLTFFVGSCITGSFSIMSTLMVDLYPEAPATAIAAVNLVRCLVGAGATAVVETVIRAMGRGWAFTFLALIVVFFSPIIWVSVTYGPGWREQRRLRRLKEKERKEAEQSG